MIRGDSNVEPIAGHSTTWLEVKSEHEAERAVSVKKGAPPDRGENKAEGPKIFPHNGGDGTIIDRAANRDRQYK